MMDASEAIDLAARALEELVAALQAVEAPELRRRAFRASLARVEAAVGDLRGRSSIG